MRVRSVTGRTRRAAVAVTISSLLVTSVGSCGTDSTPLTGGRTPEEVAADGTAEVERYRDDSLAGAITEVPELTALGEPTIRAASANEDRREIFGSIGVSPTRFTWAYRIADGANVEAVLDAAASELVARGATLDRSIPLRRDLSATSADDRLSIELIVMEASSVELAHRITVNG